MAFEYQNYLSISDLADRWNGTPENVINIIQEEKLDVWAFLKDLEESTWELDKEQKLMPESKKTKKIRWYSYCRVPYVNASVNPQLFAAG